MIQSHERGEFFDPSLSPFAYNETVANELYPLEKNAALEQWYHRQDDDVLFAQEQTIDVPDAITDVSDDILQQVITCSVSGKKFKIIKQELQFYRTNNIPVPMKHHDVRHHERLAQRPAKNLYLRTCDKTGAEIISVYPVDTPFPVYSMEAYRQEL